MYAVTVVLARQEGADKWVREGSQLPTFFLDENVQGIVEEDHARRIAMEIVRDPGAEITVVKL